MGIIIAILLFSFIILFHELGHFLLAKANGIRVDEFSLGLGPTLIGKEIGGTLFSIKLLPFGGACMMGEDETTDKDPASFNNKSVWARISVIAAGPLFNFLLAWIMSAVIIMVVGYTSPEIGEVTAGYPAEESGIRSGDVLREINGRSIHIWDDLRLYTAVHPDQETYEIVYERDGEAYTVVLEREQKEGDTSPMFGFVSAGGVHPGFFGSLEYGAYTLKYWITYTFESLRMIVGGQVGLKDLSGPVGIVDMVDEVYQASAPAGLLAIVLNLMNFGVLISANLGVMNLLPIPALDGGRLVFLFIEAVRRKRIPPEKEGVVHLAGLAALMLLMIAVMCNDIIKLF